MKRTWQSFVLFVKSPLSRISFGLVMLTVSLILISDFLGLMPDSRGNEVAFRQHIAESAAVQVSLEIDEPSPAKLHQILQAIVDRSERVLGVAVTRTDGTLVHSAGEYSNLWTLGPQAESTIEQIRIAMYTPKGVWGNFELVFDEMPVGDSMFRGGSSVLKIVAYVALAGFVGFFFFLKKVMRELDPDQVLPDRVRSALDSLADGLLILNHEGVIMFCNQAMAKRIGINARNLTGKECESLDWVASSDDLALPWQPILEGSTEVNEQTIHLRVGHHQNYQFIVNASPILGDNDEVRGALITFNDVTELEKKHAELEVAVANLEESQIEIEKKNRELFKMATRDPLTNLFNRRAFFDAFDSMFEHAQQNRSRLACIMLDIDHFKSVNDTHGHGVGDEVIKYMADSLNSFLGDVDIVGRFGGEEFCMLLPDATSEAAMQRADKIRAYIESGTNAQISAPLSITSSFGVACLPGDAKTPSELIEQADLALYEAKTSGRNRVVSWHGDKYKSLSTENNIDADANRNVRNADAISSAKSASAATPQERITAAPTSVSRVVNNQASPGALVLVEPGKTLTQRQLLAANIETAILRARRESLAMAVVVLDGASLHYIANNVDFNVGNKLCAVLVDRLKNVLRLADVVSQGEVDEVAGTVTQTDQNEIAILLSDIDSKSSIAGIVERLLAVFDQRIVIGGSEYVVDTHAGISILGDDGSDAETLLQNACMACSNANASDMRNAYSFYSNEMDEAVKRYLRLQTDLHQAVEKTEFEVFYQPKMDLVSGDVVGFEALLRWHHSELGLVSPAEFIPMAEKNGLIHQINPWVMTEVVEQIQRWLQSGHRVDAVAVNVSAVELKDPAFADAVLKIVNEAGLRANSLEIEITESIGIDELDVARTNLEKLHQAGMTISIDDFGTGYSSLGYLQHFPISRLKIDRIFVNGCTIDEKKAKVVRSIITMGTSLGMRVLAEGVETQEQLLFLRDHHCDEIQGFFVSKPVDAEQTTAMLEKPAELSQIVLAATMGTRTVGSGVKTLPLSGLDAIISRFPDAANDESEPPRQAGETAG